jgi:subfamily B ATP-binding cassette protein HlyB/CyaB
MERGQIAEIGTHADLLKNPQGIYRHLYQLQLGNQSDASSDSLAAPESDRRG